MPRMKESIILCIILFLPNVQEIKGIDMNELINRAQKQYTDQKENLKYYSFKTHITAKAMKKGGETLWDESRDFKTYVKNEEKYAEIITWIKNGKPLPQGEMKKKEKKMNKDFKEAKKEVSYWPFKPGREKYYEYELLGEEDINEYHTYKINVTPKTKDKKRELYEGHFWLEVNTSGVVKASYTTTKLPKLHKKMDIEVNYEQIQPGIWMPVSRFVKSEVSAIGYKADSELKITFSNYKLNLDLEKQEVIF